MAQLRCESRRVSISHIMIDKVTDAHEDTTEEDDKVSEDILTKIRRRSSTFLSDIFRKDSDPN